MLSVSMCICTSANGTQNSSLRDGPIFYEVIGLLSTPPEWNLLQETFKLIGFRLSVKLESNDADSKTCSFGSFEIFSFPLAIFLLYLNGKMHSYLIDARNLRKPKLHQIKVS